MGPIRNSPKPLKIEEQYGRKIVNITNTTKRKSDINNEKQHFQKWEKEHKDHTKKKVYS